MIDRELLELAAKSINLPGTWVEGFGYRVDCEEPYFWNPLTDDGEAFGLAVDLEFDLALHEGRSGAFLLRGEIEAYEPHNDTPYAATHRAIVRAAAEIGKGMK